MTDSKTEEILTYTGSRFPITGDGFEVACETITLGEKLEATIRLIRFDADGELTEFFEQECVILSAEELANEPKAILEARIEAIGNGIKAGTMKLPEDLFYQSAPTLIDDDVRSYLNEYIATLVLGGFDSSERVIEDFRFTVQDELHDSSDDVHDEFVDLLRAALDVHLETQKTWADVTTNDKITAAFLELCELGIVALENAGYTQSDGWSDVAEFREDVDNAWAGTFYHGQDVERGVLGEGLMLAFGAFANDDTHEAESLRAGKKICEVLGNHGVATTWSGTLDTRIAIDPFEWKRRRKL